MKRKIVLNGISYIKNITAFKVGNRWVPKDQLEIDTLTGDYNLITKLLRYVDLENNVAYSSKLVDIYINGQIIPLCESIFTKLKDNFIPHPYIYDTYLLLGESYKLNSKKFTPNRKVYSVKDSRKEISPYSEIENDLSFLKDYSFGIELETSGISLREGHAEALGFYELYDGSIEGPEYASGIMNYKNFHHIESFMQLLKTVSKHDSSCSLHVHVGNIPYTKENTCAIYSLFQRLQEDLNLLIAPYKKDYTYLYNKQKDHCQNLPPLPHNTFDDITTLFKIPSEGLLNLYISQTPKWNLLGRYYSVNFLNYICQDPASKTIELRSLQMTFDYNYLLTWLIINTSIIDYAVKNVKKVLDKREKIQVEDCLLHFIDNPKILTSVLANYNSIKNIIYSKKFIQKDLSQHPMVLESQMKDLKCILPSNFPNDKKLRQVLYNVRHLELNGIIVEKISKESLSPMGPIKLPLSGFYTLDNNIVHQIVPYIANAINNKYGESLDPNVNYIISHENLIVSGERVYNDESITNYCIVSKDILYYIVKQKNNTIIANYVMNNIYPTNNSNSFSARRRNTSTISERGFVIINEEEE